MENDLPRKKSGIIEYISPLLIQAIEQEAKIFLFGEPYLSGHKMVVFFPPPSHDATSSRINQVAQQTGQQLSHSPHLPLLSRCIPTSPHLSISSASIPFIIMPITIGSVGDVIAIGLLVKDCVDALSQSRGAVSSYQAVIRELYLLEKALLEIDLLARNYRNVPELQTIRESASIAVDGCRTSLQAFKTKIAKYEPHFADQILASGAKKVVKGNAMKLLWQISTRDDVTRFRTEVVAYSSSLNQLLASATMCVNEHTPRIT